MRTLYATKPDINGNTYKLIIDTERRQYARENIGFFHRSEAITTTRRALRELIENAKKDGYTETNAL